MTTLAAIQTWGSLGPSAFVLLSDSRLTDLDSKPPKVLSDCHQKTFFSHSNPYIVAFCGHDQPAEAAIHRSLSTLVDWHSPAPAMLFDELGAVIEGVLKRTATKYRVQIVHATCDTLQKKFLAEEISFDPETRTTVRRPTNIGPKQVTANLAGLGTGFDQYTDLRDADYNQHQVRKRSGPLTAAEHVQKFSQFVASGDDLSTGGHIQGVTLNIDGTAKPIAFRYDNEFFLFGKPAKWDELRGDGQIELRSPKWHYLSHKDGDIKGKASKGTLGKLL